MKRRTRVASVMAASVLAFGTAFSALPAFAALGAKAKGEDPEMEEAGDASTIDESRSEDASLKIVKLEGGALSSASNNGKEDAAANSATKLGGVKFSYCQVPGIDLTTNAGWKEANKITKTYTTTAPCTPDNKKEAATNDNGEVTFSNLALGLYYVVETDASGAYKMDKGQKTPLKGVVPAKPFLVTLPMTDQTNHNEWMYDVVVYPKNSVLPATKTVSDDNVNKDGTISYTLEFGLPQAGTKFDKYVIRDTLSSAFSADDVVAKDTDSSRPVTVKFGDETLTKTTHYTVTKEGTNTLVVTFTEEGLKKLVEGDRTKKVTMSFTAAIKTDAYDTGNIDNRAYVIPSSDYGTPTDPETPGNPPTPEEEFPNEPPTTDKVTTPLGKVTFTKVNGEKETEKLQGAEFKLYECSDWNETDSATPLTADGQTSWTSSQDGTFTITGLRFSNYKNGEQISDEEEYFQYCLVETKAPANMELLPKPIHFTVTAEDMSAEEGATEWTTVKNFPKNGGFELPTTGSAALVTMLVAGVLLVAGGGFFFVRKREEEQQ